jgi:hypothetical protein
MERAAIYKPNHTMVVDADDCVSSKIAAYVEKYPDHPGWVIKCGFLHREGTWLAYKNLKNFNESCGSSVIIRYDLQQHLIHSEIYYGHEHPVLPAPLQVTPLPFPGAVYNIRNGENFFMTKKRVADHKRKEGGLGYFFRKALKYRPVLITNSFRQRFNLYSLAR